MFTETQKNFKDGTSRYLNTKRRHVMTATGEFSWVKGKEMI